jgi:hypothetical protein
MFKHSEGQQHGTEVLQREYLIKKATPTIQILKYMSRV